MTVRTQVRLTLAMLLLLIAGISVYAGITLRSLDGTIHDLSGDNMPELATLQDINAKVTAFRVREASHILSLAPEDMDARETEMATLKAQIDELTKKFVNGHVTEQEKAKMKEFMDIWQQYLTINKKLLPLSRKFDSHEHIDFLDQATAIFNKESFPLYTKASSIVTAIAEAKLNETNEAADATGHQSERALRIIIVVAGFAILFGLASALFFDRSVMRRLLAAVRQMRALSTGEHDMEILGTERRDEIGEMAKALHVFKDNALEKIRFQAQQEEADKNASIEKKRMMNALADDFELTVKGVVNEVSSSAQQMRGNAERLTTLADDTQQRSGVVASAATDAAQTATQVAAAAEQLTAAIGEISAQVQKSSTVASQAGSQAESINQSMQLLVEKSNRVGEVIQFITNIASQINLLALNATIESARAGEAGRGFAVVASEVKNLATQTAKATEEIVQQVQSMQEATQEAVQSVTQISGIINEISANTAGVAAAVEEQSAATNEISRNIAHTANGTNEISRNIGAVQQGAEETGTSSSQVLTAAQALTHQTITLNEKVNEFLATVRAA